MDVGPREGYPFLGTPKGWLSRSDRMLPITKRHASVSSAEIGCRRSWRGVADGAIREINLGRLSRPSNPGAHPAPARERRSPQ